MIYARHFRFYVLYLAKYSTAYSSSTASTHMSCHAPLSEGHELRTRCCCTDYATLIRSYSRNYAISASIFSCVATRCCCNIMRTSVISYSVYGGGAPNLPLYLWQALLLGPQAHLAQRVVKCSHNSCPTEAKAKTENGRGQRAGHRLKSSEMPLTGATCAVICRQQRQVQSKRDLPLAVPSFILMLTQTRPPHSGQVQSKGNWACERLYINIYYIYF